MSLPLKLKFVLQQGYGNTNPVNMPFMNGLPSQMLHGATSVAPTLGNMYASGINPSQEAADYWTGKIPGLGNGLTEAQQAAVDQHKLNQRQMSANVDPLQAAQGWAHHGSWNQHQA